MGKESKKILLVNGDQNTRDECRKALSTAGYAVDTADDGMEALVKLKRSFFDLVVADVKTPVLDGISLYLNTLKFSTGLKDRFLFLADGACRDIEERSVLSNLKKKFIIKPFKMKEFMDNVEGFMGGSTAEAAILKLNERSANKRVEKRYSWEEDCRVAEKNTYNPKPFTATLDISRHGMRIRYIGIPFRAGHLIRVDIRSLKIHTAAMVVWSKAVTELESMSGLKLSDEVSSSMVTVIEGKKEFIPPLVSTRR